MSPVTATLSTVDSSKPEVPARVTLTSTIDKYTHLSLNGTTKPFDNQLTMDIGGTLKGFDLTGISGYAARFLGYDLQRGRLDADLQAKIVEGKLDSSSTLVISKLAVDPTDPSRLGPLGSRIEVPLETALSLLRREGDVIRLNIPVSGDLSNPQFDFSDGINQAVSGAIVGTMSTLLQVAFPIAGAIRIIADAAGNKHLQITPVMFEPGQAVLAPAERAHLDEVEKFLLDRPTAMLTLCAHATAADREALLSALRAEAAKKSEEDKKPDGQHAGGKPPEITVPEDALSDLARMRGEAVKDELLARDGISEDRLFLCAPEVSLDAPEDQPRVDLQF
jgi:hypothetical protein